MFNRTAPSHRVLVIVVGKSLVIVSSLCSFFLTYNASRRVQPFLSDDATKIPLMTVLLYKGAYLHFRFTHLDDNTDVFSGSLHFT